MIACNRRGFVATDFKPANKETLRGFVTLTLPSGLKIKDVSVHQRGTRRWVAMPGKPFQKPDGSTGYVNFIDFETDEAKHKFQDLAVEAIDKLIARSGRV